MTTPFQSFNRTITFNCTFNRTFNRTITFNQIIKRSSPFYLFISMILIGILFMLLAQPVIADSSPFPVQVIDDRQRSVTIKKRPESVAAISVFAADVLKALGRSVVGLSTLNQKRTLFLGEHVEKIANLGEIHVTNMEVLTQLQPDLIVGIRTYTEPHEKKFEEISQFLAFDLIDFQDSIRSVQTLTTALGEKQRGEQFNRQFQQQLKTYHQRAPGGLTALFLWYWDEMPFAFYDHHLVPEIMKHLKVTNSFGASAIVDTTKHPFAAPISMEKIMQLNPDVIIAFKGGNSDFLPHPVWQHLNAVKNRRVYRVADHYVMPHGPIARDMVLRELAHLFYPEQFNPPTDIPVKAQAQPVRFNH